MNVRVLQPGPEALAAAHQEKRVKLLDEAAREFNARGIAGASFARIAGRLGLTRPALYYYVRDRENLAVECYRRSCATMAEDLAAASLVPADGLARVVSFVTTALDPDRPTRAVLSDLDCLAGKAKAEIENAHAQNVETLRALLRAGMTDGSVRASDDLVIAQVLIGTIAWVPLSPGWVEGTDTTFRERTIAALADLIVGGEVIDRTWHYQTQVDIARFFLPPAHAFDRQAAHAAKIETLLMRASQLFNRRGIDGVSLDDVAGQVGATKGVLYHYFRNKTDLVVSCMKRAFALYERFADAADAAPDGIGKAFTGTYLNIEAQVSGLSPLIQMVGVEALPAAARRDVTRRARQLQRRFEAFGKQARREGSFRDLDFDAVAQLGAGAFEWLPKWLPDTSLSRGHVTREILDLFAHGLKA